MKNNIPQGYKATPLGIIPQEWEVKRFKDVGNFLRNNTLPRDKMSESEGCVQNIHYGDVLVKYREILKVSKANIPWIVENSKDSPLGDMLQNGDIVISDTAEDYTVGKATELMEIDGASVVAGLHTMPFHPLSDLFSPCFLGYYINSMAYRFQLYALIQGIKVCAISKKAIGGTFLIVPPLAEQRKIAEVLCLWDKAIEKQSQLIEQLTLRKRGLMQQLLTAKHRLPGFSSLCQKIRLEERCEKTGNDDDKKEKIGQGALISQGYKPTSFGFIPQEWVVMPLSKAFRIQSGYAFKSELFTKNCGTPVVRISNLPMNDKYIDLSDCVYYPVSIDVKEQFIIHKNDFLIAMSGATTGKSAIYNYDYEALLNQRVGVFRQISDKIDNQYLHIIMESQWFIFQLQYLLIAGAQPNISPSDVENMVFPIPSLSEQKAIAQVLTAADREIELAQQKLELLRQQKRGLMQQLLTD